MVNKFEKNFLACRLCPRQCGANRFAGATGYCGESDQLRVAAIEAHFGEEPPISGTQGSGTVFFSGCSLKCLYCQNYQISHEGVGKSVTVASVADKLAFLIRQQHIHNINFVTPDHFFPRTIAIVDKLREKKFHLPIVYNLSGYQSISSLHLIEAVADIYLPDFKYSDSKLATQLSNCRDYPQIALSAIAEMVRQKGFLDSVSENDNSQKKIASRGVLVRHLIIPGQIKNSLDALTMLFVEFGAYLPLSLMSQYCPVRQFHRSFLNRPITQLEFSRVYEHAQQLGFHDLFVQFPEATTALSAQPFLPNFLQEQPFVGNVR